MLESVRALRPMFLVLTTVASGEKVEHVFAMPRELPPAAYGTLTIPLNIKMLVRRRHVRAAERRFVADLAVRK